MGGHVISSGGSTDLIEFMTAAPVKISNFQIHASSDGAGDDFRGFQQRLRPRFAAGHPRRLPLNADP